MKPPFRSSHIPTRALLTAVFFLLAAALETAQAQVVTLSPASLSFGSVAVGTTSPGKTVTLRNTSTTTALSVTSIVSSGNFAETNTCGTSVAAGARCVITVTFKPAALGASTGSIVITDNPSPATQTIALTGTGISPITISPASHSFGSVGEGSTSAPFNFTVRNYQATAAALTISTAAPFAQTNTCGTSLAANSTCSISATFSPTTAGAQTGTVAVAYTGTGSPQTATLTGTGVAPITISPASLRFGSVTQGTTSAAKTFAVKNNTTATIPITVSSSNTEFAETGCGASLAAGASCTVSVTFAPTVTATGPQTGSIAVAYTGTGSPQSVSVTGTAVSPLSVQPTSITFPANRAVGTPSQAQSVTITNRSNSAVAIGSIVASPAAFAITANTCTSSLAAAASCAVTVVFTPTVAGTTTGTLTITYGAAQLVVSMTGQGQVNNLVSLVITAPSPSLAVGASEQLTATGTYGSGATGNVTSTATWTSSNTGVATVVSNTGVVTGVATGTTTITAAVIGANRGTVKNTATLTVTGKALTSITLTGTQGSTTSIGQPTLAAGTTLQVYATGVYGDGSTQDVTSLATWSSSSTASATVAPGGLITAVSAGTPTISASLSGITGSTGVTVTAATLQSISISPAGTTTVAAGKTQQFTATGTFTGNTTQNITSNVTWSSSNPNVTMSTTTPGLATTTAAAANQSTTISATQGSVSAATATLNVSAAALVSIAVTPDNASIASGTTETFTAIGTYSDSSTHNLTSSVTWSAATSSGGGAATFTGNSFPNVAKATAPGVVTITATSGSISGSTPLTVTAPVLTSIVVTSTPPANPPVAGTPAVVTIHQGQTQQFYALGTYSDSSIQNLTGTVAWSAGTGSVATVSTSGATAGLATSVAAGAVAISATSGSITSTTTGGDGSLTVIGLTSVTIAPANPTAPLGDANPSDPYGPTNNTLQFTATANYTNSTTADVTASATWTSGTLSVATIGGATGLATLLTVGTSTITATYAGVSGNTMLTVTPALLESITVSPAGVSLGLNGTKQFTATGNYSDGTTADLTQTATWASFNPQVVTVNSTGLATVAAATNAAVAVTASSGTIAPYGATNTAWVSALSTLPITCPTPTIDMRLLVINNAGANAGAGYADFPAIQQILNYVGTPYDVVDVVTGTLPALSDGACHGYYQGVIYAFGDDIYTNAAFNQALTSYEQTFKVRRLNWFTNPTPDFGFNYYVGSVPDTGTDSGGFTSAAAPVFFYANRATPVAIANAFIYLTTPTTPSGGGTVTPLLVDSGGYTLSGITNFSDGREYLSQMFDSNPYLTHDLVLAYGLLNWVTKGVFLGDYHVYATQEIDDLFIDDSEWIPSTTCLTNLATKDRTAPDASNLPVFRVDAADMTQLVNWQNGIQNDPSGLFSQFKLTMAFNGVGTVGNGDWTGLTAPIILSSAANGVASFTAQSFSGLPGQSVTVTNTTNGNGVLNGIWTIASVTSSAATTPGTTTFTANISAAGALGPLAETATATVADDLVANLQSYQGAFHWINHTYDHPSTLNGLCQNTPTGAGCGDVNNGSNPTDDIDLEILTNRWVASDPNAPGSWMLDTDPKDTVKQLTFTDFNPVNIVTPGITGLNDPNVPTYLYNDGIRYAVSDTSVATTTNPPNNNGPNPSPNVGIVNISNGVASGIYEVPRHPNDIFYNAANWADDQAEFVCIYQNYVPPGAPAGTQPAPLPPFNTYNAAQILDFTSSAFVTNMLMGDMDPEMFHQPDLHFADNYPALTATPFGPPNPPVTIPGLANPHVSSLIGDTYDLTFSKYKALYNLPVLSPTLDQMGALMQNRNSFNLSGVTASIVVGTSGSQITITMPSTATIQTAVIPVTGVTSTGSEMYGGQNISHININPGQSITFPLP